MQILPSPLSKTVRVALSVAAIRIGAFWWLFILHIRGKESIDEILLLLMMYPEALAIPRNSSWTLARGIGFSGALLAGSISIAALITAMLRLARGEFRSEAKEP